MAKFKVTENAKQIAQVNNNLSSQPAYSVGEPEELAVRCEKCKKESSLWEDFDKDDSNCPILTSQAERELEQYLSISYLLHSDDPLSHGVHFPHLTPLTKNA